MSLSTAKVCPLCGFDDCESIAQSLAAKQSINRVDQSATIGVVDRNQQIEAAAELLARSKSTLICGLDNLESAAQMAAWRLADQVHAIVDSSLVNRSHASTQSMQRHGKVSATYGEIRNRSDLLVFWDCDLKPKHACLLRLLSSGRVPNRKIVFVGSSSSPMAQVADFVFDLDNSKNRNSMVRLICRLRALAAGRSLPEDRYLDCDLSQQKVNELFGLLKHASYGSLFFSSHEADWEFDLETESLLQLISEFNAISPLVGIKIRDDANGLGAETVMSLASGFPSAISLQRGQAFCSGGLYTASEVLRRSGCDVMLLCGNTDDVSHLVPEWMKNRLKQMTVIQLAPRSEAFADLFIACPTVEFGTAFAGNVFRGDGAMLSSIIPNTERSAEAVLNSLEVAYQKVLAKVF